MENHVQNIKSGKNSANIQNNFYGADVALINEIISLRIKDEFQKYTQEASSILEARVDEIRDEIIKKFSLESGNASKAANPDIQYAIQTTVIEFARTGDKEKMEDLLNILDSKLSNESGSLISNVIDDALKVAGRLTNAEISLITAVFLFRYLRAQYIFDRQGFYNLVNNFRNKYYSDLPKTTAPYLHLESLGCISIEQLVNFDLVSSIKQNYPHLVMSELASSDFSEDTKLFLKSISVIDFDLNRISLAPNYGNFISITNNIPEQQLIQQELFEKVNSSSHSKEEFEKILESESPEFKELNEFWKKTDLNKVRLSSTGIVIAHASVRKQLDLTGDLSIWIN